MRTKIALAALIPVVLFAAPTLISGPQVRERLIPFVPTHVTGPDANDKLCFVCKYGTVPGAQVWIHGDTMANAGIIAQALDQRISKAGGVFKFNAYLVFVVPEKKPVAKVKAELITFSNKNKLKNVFVTFVPDSKVGPVRDYRINRDPAVKNTVMTHFRLRATSNFVNLKADTKGLRDLDDAVTSTLKLKAQSRGR